MTLDKIRQLFDLGVTIVVGDDGVTLVGRDFHPGEELQTGYTYVETVFEFDSDTTLSEIFKHVKERKTKPQEPLLQQE